MKYLGAVLLIPLAVSAQVPPRQQLIFEAVKDYGTVIGGAAVNDRCKFLDDAHTSAYQADIGVITPALNQDIGNPKLLSLAMDAGLAEAQSEKYADCGPKAREIVDAASSHAKNWAQQIRRIQSMGK